MNNHINYALSFAQMESETLLSMGDSKESHGSEWLAVLDDKGF